MRTASWPFRRIKSIFNQVIDRIFYLMFDEKWFIDHFSRGRSGSRTVLLVRLDLIGDFTLWLDSAAAYRQIYPERKLVLCANRLWAELARQQPYWDDFVPIICMV
jgi:hypothetical protein